MGLAMSVVAHLYRRARRRVAEHEKNRALRETEERFRRREQEVLRRYELLAANTRDIVLFVRGSDGPHPGGQRGRRRGLWVWAGGAPGANDPRPEGR